ncbi:LacI family DNA-binding transcriptional regulator [Polaribacter sp. SA4-12]|uniref:LacI family DNA-binding transcriptional regulator n=1 Tax=Polaribacter sp. SA4-12 TaxID=1312072 RepID=UPI000B3BEF42|nr:LacI family DNA-binding transcriptional regulator [Polaribacter sp. SA4-12]ARV16568.1 LacI family transcriptional regulator [Polaribacter sp. SA4-12]
MKYITIKDIAKKLNTSVSTVSRAFNNKSDISVKTKELVLKTAKEMGYRQNRMAKNLVQKRSFNIGIVVPEFVNSFFPEVIIGAQEVFFSKGYQVLITQSNECFETELKNVQSLENSMVDGMLISLSSETANIDYYQDLVNSGFPIVFFNRTYKEIKASKVLFNDYKWSFFATEHLIRQGYINIYHLQGDNTLSLSKERKRGFLDAHKKHHLTVRKDQIIASGFNLEDGEKIAKYLIKKNSIPDAIFAATDPLAIGAMKVFKANGYKIPKDIAFTGFSESKLATIIEPQLSSVKQPTFKIGIEAAKLLIDQIENGNEKNYAPKIIVLNGELNIRESSRDVSGKII